MYHPRYTAAIRAGLRVYATRPVLRRPFSVARTALKDAPAGSGNANDGRDNKDKPDTPAGAPASDAGEGVKSGAKPEPASASKPKTEAGADANSQSKIHDDLSESAVKAKNDADATAQAKDESKKGAKPSGKSETGAEGRADGKLGSEPGEKPGETPAAKFDKIDVKFGKFPNGDKSKPEFRFDPPESAKAKAKKDNAELENALRSAAAATTRGWRRTGPYQRGDDVFNPAAAVASGTIGGANASGGEGENGGSNNIAPVTKNERFLPIELPFRPAFPGMAMHFTSTDPKVLSAVPKLMETKQWNGLVVAVMSRRQLKTTELVTNADDAHEVGCVCRLRTTMFTKSSEDMVTMYGTLFPLYRVRAGELVETVRGGSAIRIHQRAAAAETDKEEGEAQVATQNQPPNPLDSVNVQWMKGVTALPNEPYAYTDKDVQQLCTKIIDKLRSLANLSPFINQEVEKFSKLVPNTQGGDFPQPDFLADFAASLVSNNEPLQDILEQTNVKERLRAVNNLVDREISYIQVQSGLFKYANEQTGQRVRENVLLEYLRYIKKELGMDGDEKSKAADKFLERANALEMPKDVRKVFDEELNRFRGLESTAGEYATVRSYLDWLTSIPWGKYSPDKFVIRKAREILENSHYGLQDVKDRILEFLAVAKLSGSVDGKIVCLAGPPGVGKTSIAQAIASALGRKFDRFSVGGLHDVSEIKGHRRTYVASLPGRLMQALKKTQTQNPVILIDEIDKVGRHGSHGDPTAALLEVLDPEQNKNFQDTYMEVPVDLSRVLFVCTANDLENIPGPLKDRMEIINIPGYLPIEKVEIAKAFLAPKAAKESGLKAAEITFTEDALSRIVNNYTREAGVRGLNKTIEKIYRKIAYKFVREREEQEEQEAATKEASLGDSADKAVSDDAGDGNRATEAPATQKVVRAVSDALRQAAEASQQGEDDTHPAVTEVKIEPEEVALRPQISDEIVRNVKLDVGREELLKYIGPAPFSSNRLYERMPAGVAMGLAWTPMGGMPLFIETVLQEALSKNSKARLSRTGHLGDVMKESASIAHSFSRMFMNQRYPRNLFLDHASLHTHFPEGAIKKDGPSAGIAMVTSLLSLAMNTPASNDVAMTGEVSLTGKVLQIGGLREKAVAARTAGAKIIVFPAENMAEWEDLPEVVREGLEARPVSTYEEVFDLVFGAVDPAQVNSTWPQLRPEESDKSKKKSAIAPQST